jgi:DNA-binding MarR family transcriptional regulator
LIEQRVRRGLRKEFKTTLPRFDVLAQLERAPKGMTMGQLSSHLMVSNGNITGLIDRLDQEGLVNRAPSPSDRRTQMVKLSNAGRKALNKMLPMHERWIVELLTNLSSNDMSQILTLLGRVKDSLENSVTNAPDLKERADEIRQVQRLQS